MIRVGIQKRKSKWECRVVLKISLIYTDYKSRSLSLDKSLRSLRSSSSSLAGAFLAGAFLAATFFLGVFSSSFSSSSSESSLKGVKSKSPSIAMVRLSIEWKEGIVLYTDILKLSLVVRHHLFDIRKHVLCELHPQGLLLSAHQHIASSKGTHCHIEALQLLLHIARHFNLQQSLGHTLQALLIGLHLFRQVTQGSLGLGRLASVSLLLLQFDLKLSSILLVPSICVISLQMIPPSQNIPRTRIVGQWDPWDPGSASTASPSRTSTACPRL